MASWENIDAKFKQLDAYRRTLHHLLGQLKIHTLAHVPPATMSGIEEARQEIRRIKSILSGWGVYVENDPNDEGTVEDVKASAISAGNDFLAKLQALYRVEPSSSVLWTIQQLQPLLEELQK